MQMKDIPRSKVRAIVENLVQSELEEIDKYNIYKY